MDKTSLEKGTKIYFNGDMANEEGFGIITNQRMDQFGTIVDIKMEDGREFSTPIGIFSDEYAGHGGTRFVTKEAYDKFRQAMISKVKATLAKAKENVKGSTPAEERRDLREKEQKEYKRKIDSGWKPGQPVSDDRLDELLEDASREAEKRGESDEKGNKGTKLMDSLEALKLGFEYRAKLAAEVQLKERKMGYNDGFHRGRAKAYREAAKDLNKIIKA